jgi:hypothetical protein
VKWIAPPDWQSERRWRQPGQAPIPSRLPGFTSRIASLSAMAILMVTRIWHGATPASKSDEYLNLMRTVAIPDYRSTPGNKGAYALRRIEGDTAFSDDHVLGVEEAIRTFARDDISGAKYKAMTLTRTSCSNWSRAPRIRRYMTGKPIRLWLRRCPLSARS